MRKYLRIYLPFLIILSMQGCGGGGGSSSSGEPTDDSDISALVDSDSSDNVVSNNAEPGTNVGITAFATDEDEGDTVSYSLIDSASDRFAINGTTGVVSVNLNTILLVGSYSIKVRATSSDESFSEADFVIVVEDGGSQSEFISLSFPPPGLYEGEQIDVYGQVVDADTAQSVIVEVGSETVEATLAADGSWRAANVPLGAVGEKMITVTLDDATFGQVNIQSPLTVVEPTLLNPTDMVEYGDKVLLLDRERRAIFSVDLVTKKRTIISGIGKGEGPVFYSPQAFTVDVDSNTAYVVDNSLRAIFSVDLEDGNRSIFLDRDSQLTITASLGILLDKLNNRLILHTRENNVAAYYSIDLTTKAYQPFGNDSTIDIVLPVDMILAQDPVSDEAIALVADFGAGAGAVVAINLSAGTENDGKRRVISSSGNVNQGLPLAELTAIGFDASAGSEGEIFAVTENQGIFKIDYSSGNRTVVSVSGGSGPPIGSGDDFVDPRGLVFSTQGPVVLQDSPSELLAVNLDNGDRTVLINANRRGSGRLLRNAQWVDVFQDSGEVVVANDGTLIKVNPISGERTTLRIDAALMGVAVDSVDHFIYFAGDERVDRVAVDGSGETAITVNDINEGPNITPLDLALDKDNNRLLAATFEGALVEVDLGGDRTLLSTADTANPVGDGPDIIPESVAYQSGSQQAFVVGEGESGSRALAKIELSNGDREVLLESESLSVLNDVAVDSKRNRLLLTDSGFDFGALRGVNLSSNDNNIISGDEVGRGTPLRSLYGVAMDAKRDLIFVVDRSLNALIAIDPASGNRVVVSR